MSNIFSEHNILKFHDLVKHNELTFMHKYVNNMLPSSFNDKFVKLTSFDRSFSFQMDFVKSPSFFLNSNPVIFQIYRSLPLCLNNFPYEWSLSPERKLAGQLTICEEQQ